MRRERRPDRRQNTGSETALTAPPPSPPLHVCLATQCHVLCGGLNSFPPRCLLEPVSRQRQRLRQLRCALRDAEVSLQVGCACHPPGLQDFVSCVKISLSLPGIMSRVMDPKSVDSEVNYVPGTLLLPWCTCPTRAPSEGASRCSACVFPGRGGSVWSCHVAGDAWNGNRVELLIKDISFISEEHASFRV